MAWGPASWGCWVRTDPSVVVILAVAGEDDEVGAWMTTVV